MEGEDEESESGSEDEEDSDDARDDMDRKVAKLLETQQHYIQMCNSSSQILQFLSHLVPGMALSTQMMELESVTEDSEESAPRSESVSSTNSPATSEDNAGCIVWAEPIMTCQLMPSWKTCCNDVRRLPPGVTPDDIKSQREARRNGPGNSNANTFAGGNRSSYIDSRKDYLHHLLAANEESGSRHTNLHTSYREDGSIPATGKGLESAGLTRADFSDTKLKTSVYTDNVKSAEMARTTGGTSSQANNNNNPEVSSGEGSNQNPGASTSEQPLCDCNRNDRSCDEPTTVSATAAEGTCTGECDQSTSTPKSEEDENKLHLQFPPPVLVKSAGTRTEALRVRFEDSGNMTSTIQEISTNRTHSESQNSQWSHDQTLQTTNFLEQYSFGRKPNLPSRHFSATRPPWGARLPLTDVQEPRAIRRSLANRQLYRHPNTIGTASQQIPNRTQQSVCLGGNSTDCQASSPRKFPPERGKLTGQSLGLDFSTLDVARDANKREEKHVVTMDQFKLALETALKNLEKLDSWTVSENSVMTDANPQMMTTVSNFSLTEVESINMPHDGNEKDSECSDTVEAIMSDRINDATHVLDSGDAAKSDVDLTTQVEDIFYVPNRSPGSPSPEEGVDRNKQEWFSSEREINRDVSRTNSSCEQPTGQCNLINKDDLEMYKNTPQAVSHSHKSHASVSVGTSCQARAGSNSSNAESPRNTDRAHDVSKESDEVIHKLEMEEKGSTTHFCDTGATESQKTNLQNKGGSDEIAASPVRHPSLMRLLNESAVGNFRSAFKSKLAKVRSANDSHPVQDSQRNGVSREPSRVDDRRNLPYGKHLDYTCAAEGKSNFPSNLPEAGDAAELLPKLSDTLRNRATTDQNATATEMQTRSNKDADSCSKNKVAVCLKAATRRKKNAGSKGKNAWQNVAKILLDMHTRRTDNQFLTAENIRAVDTSENNKEVDPGKAEHDVKHEDTAKLGGTRDKVVEISIKQEEQRPPMASGEDNHRRSPGIARSVHSLHNKTISSQSFSAQVKGKSQDNSASLLDQSDSVNSSLYEASASKGSEDVSVNGPELSIFVRSIPLQKTNSVTSGSQSSQSAGMLSLRKTKTRGSKLENYEDSNGKVTSLDHGVEKIRSNSLISSDSTKCLDILPGLLPDDSSNVGSTVPVTLLKSTVIHNSPVNLQLVPAENCTKSSFFDELNKELEDMVDDQKIVAPNSLINGKVCPESSINGKLCPECSIYPSTETHIVENELSQLLTSVPSPAAIAPTTVSSSSSIAPPPETTNKKEDGNRNPEGIKARLKLCFARCLHPFGKRH